MKSLLYLLIIGFVCWIGSEALEMIQGGYTAVVYCLTAAYHILAGIGIWGLHLVQADKRNNLSLLGTALISVTYFALAYFPIQVMHSELTVSEFLTAYPGYKIPGSLSLVGFILFGIAVIRIKYFPIWTAIITILCTLIYLAAMVKQFQIVVNINNIILATVIIYMGVLGLEKGVGLQKRD